MILDRLMLAYYKLNKERIFLFMCKNPSNISIIELFKFILIKLWRINTGSIYLNKKILKSITDDSY
jgi:hypothetical protein